jgi:hypothetical protein
MNEQIDNLLEKTSKVKQMYSNIVNDVSEEK